MKNKVDAKMVVGKLKAALGLRRDNQLAERLGMGKAALSERIRRNSLPLDKIKGLCLESGINYESLFSDAISDVSSSVNVPLYEVNAYARNGPKVGAKRVNNTLSISKRVLEDLNLSPASILCHYVNGDCMEPTLHMGELVAIDASDTKFNHDGSIYVLRIGNSQLIRRLVRRSAEEVEVVSDNKKLGSFKISAKELAAKGTVIGRVVLVWRRL